MQKLKEKAEAKEKEVYAGWLKEVTEEDGKFSGLEVWKRTYEPEKEAKKKSEKKEDKNKEKKQTTTTKILLKVGKRMVQPLYCGILEALAKTFEEASGALLSTTTTSEEKAKGTDKDNNDGYPDDENVISIKTQSTHTRYRSEAGEFYFENVATGDVTWDLPDDGTFEDETLEQATEKLAEKDATVVPLVSVLNAVAGLLLVNRFHGSKDNPVHHKKFHQFKLVAGQRLVSSIKVIVDSVKATLEEGKATVEACTAQVSALMIGVVNGDKKAAMCAEIMKSPVFHDQSIGPIATQLLGFITSIVDQKIAEVMSHVQVVIGTVLAELAAAKAFAKETVAEETAANGLPSAEMVESYKDQPLLAATVLTKVDEALALLQTKIDETIQQLLLALAAMVCNYENEAE